MWNDALFIYYMKRFFFSSPVSESGHDYALLFARSVVIATSAYAVIAPFTDATGLSQGCQALLVPPADDAKSVFLFNVCHLIPVGDAGHCAVHVDDHGAERV